MVKEEEGGRGVEGGGDVRGLDQGSGSGVRKRERH